MKADPDVANWTPVQFITLELDGQAVPFMFEPPGASIAPPLLSGHAVNGPQQLVVGPATLADLHKQVGDTVEASYEGQHRTLRIVGTATFPAIGVNGSLHPSTGSGAVASTQILHQSPDPVCGFPADMMLIRMRPKVGAAESFDGHTTHCDGHQPDLQHGACEQQLLRRPRFSAAGSGPGGDRRLPHDWLGSRATRCCTRTGSGCGARPDARRLGAEEAAGLGDPQGSGVHQCASYCPRSAGNRRWRWVSGSSSACRSASRSADGCGHCSPGRSSSSPPESTVPLLSVILVVVGRVGLCEPCRHHSRAYRRPHAHGARGPQSE